MSPEITNGKFLISNIFETLILGHCVAFHTFGIPMQKHPLSCSYYEVVGYFAGQAQVRLTEAVLTKK